jgi:outer membrane beta-barrel protein
MRSWPLLLALMVTLSLVVTEAYGASGDDDDEGGTTIVTSRGPEDRGLKVRNKFFHKRGRLEITPTFGFIPNNAFNTDMTGGVDFAIHLTERFAIELGGKYAFLSGSNQKGLAVAVLQLTDDYLLEATEPGAFVHGGVLWSPMYGKINPMGIAVINLDFFFALGLAYVYEEVELLELNYTTGSAGITHDINKNRPASYQNHLPALHLGVGMKIFATRGFSLRIDGRFYLSADKILDFSTTGAADTNQTLIAGAGGTPPNPYLNRLDCDNDSGAACVLTMNTTFLVSIGGSIWVPKPKVEDY